MSKYVSVVGDIHGCYESFLALLARLPEENNRIILVGDLVDRGPKSYETFRYVKDHQLETVLGNHDYMLMRRNDSPQMYQLWIKNGGDTVIKSIQTFLKTDKEEDIEDALTEMGMFFYSLPLKIEIADKAGQKLLISHAGIGKSVYEGKKGDLAECFAIDLMREESCLWTREDLAQIPGTMQIVGHTPLEAGPYNIEGNYHIDTGCVYNRPGMHYLTALVFDTEKDEPPQIVKQPGIE